MAADEKQVSALIRRHEQVKRWEGSDTNLEPIVPSKNRVKVQFQDGCVFLAACSSGDKDEVEKLLQRGADINTANVDGLTALHQACIDDNLEMVEFLVEKGADVDVCDNEGWTPLHATASCAFTEIARYLINHNANVAAVNNDGDLPIDIAENDEMENLLQAEMNKQGIDAEAARCEEEQRMLEDANQWLRNKCVEEVRHPKTGATALHVAAAKGYLKVMNVLLEAGVDVNAEDNDGWTALHAAAHWGQEEACKILVENMCDMMYKNKAGHTAFDLAEKDMLKLLEELKEKQASVRSKHAIDRDIILSSGHGGKRRSSVTRMSCDQKQNVIQRTSEEERAALASLHPHNIDDKIINSNSITTEDKFIEDSETERQNEKNKQVSQQPQLPTSTSISTSTTTTWSRPTSTTNSATNMELRWPDMPKIEELSETDRQAIAPVIPATIATVTIPTKPSISTTLPPSVQPAPSTETATVLSPRPSVSISKAEKHFDQNNDTTVQYRLRKTGLLEQAHRSQHFSYPIDSEAKKPAKDLVSQSISDQNISLPTQKDTLNQNELSMPSWRQGLRKTGSTSMVHERMAQNDSNNLPRSSSSPRLALDSRLESLHESLVRNRLSSTGSIASSTTTVPPSASTVTTTDSEAKPGDRNSYTFGQSYPGYRSIYGGRTGSYVSSYQQRQQQRETQLNSEDKLGTPEVGRLQDRNSVSGITTTTSSTTTPSPNHANASTTTTTSTTTTSSVFRRSYEPPKRDEETETQRKARAKHARQTRRSTQGVSLEDIEKAEESLKIDKDVTDTSSSHLPSSRNSLITKGTSGSGETASTTGVPTASLTTTTSSISSTTGDGDLKDDRSVISAYRHRTTEDKTDTTDAPSSRSSYRRAREDKDINTSGVTSTYVPRSQRNSAQQSADAGSSSPSLLRSSSLRSSRQADQATTQAEEETKKDEANGQDKKEEKKETSSIRARRQRRERRSTGIVMDNEDGEASKDSKPEEDKKDEDVRTSKDSKPEEDKKDYTVIMSYGSHRYGAGGSSNLGAAGSAGVGGTYGSYTPTSGTYGSSIYGGGNGYSSSGMGSYPSSGVYSGGSYSNPYAGSSYGGGGGGGGGSYGGGGVGSKSGSFHGHSPSPYSSTGGYGSSVGPGIASPSPYSSNVGTFSYTPASALGSSGGSSYSSSIGPTSPSPYIPGSKVSSSLPSSPSPYIPGSSRLGSGSGPGYGSSTLGSSGGSMYGSSGLPSSSAIGSGSSTAALGLSSSSTLGGLPPAGGGGSASSTSSLSGTGLGSMTTLPGSGVTSSSGLGSGYSSRAGSTTSLPGSSTFASGLSASLGNLGSSRYGRYNNSDFPSQRPVSYSEVSKSTGSLDIDYKKKYEDEKSENDRLRKELEETKKNLLEAKAELDKIMKQKDAARNTDRDKRAMERRLSEMEEELKKMESLKADNQRLKDENGALIRVISKLSK